MKNSVKFISLVLTLVMVLSIIPLGTIPVKAATLTLSELQAKFPDGKYWNHYVNNTSQCYNYYKANKITTANEDSTSSTACWSHSASGYDGYVYHYDCNRFDGATQCNGFAYKLAYDAYSSNARGWTPTTSISSLKPGDIVHYKGAGADPKWGHWVFVTAVSGSTITVGECNWGGNCLIKWGRSFNLNNASSYTIYSAPYALTTNAPTPTYTIDSRYPTPFKAHALSLWSTENGKTPVYSSINGAQDGNIYNGYNSGDDECTINEVYTNGWCKVSVPGITGDRYCKLSVFISDGYTPSNTSVSSKTITYTRSDGSTSYGYIGAGDSVTKVGSSGSYTQVIYPLTAGGYKCAWAKIDTSSANNNYPTPFKANTLLWWNTSDGKTPVYNDVNGSQSGNIYNGYNDEDDECVIEEIYTNGWCKITVPGLSGYRYCQLSVFINAVSGYNIRSVTAPEWAQAYRRGDHGSPAGYVDAGDNIYIVAENDSMYQVVYPTSGYSYCRWIDKCALGHSYTTTVTRPTCTAQGYTTHTCSVCGNSYKDSYTSANGHNYSYIETKYPSTAATGTLTGSCANCTSTTTVTLPKLNTTDYSYSVTKNATCTESGTGRYAWKTTTYGNFYFEVSIPSTGHNYTTVTTEPTCTTDGYTVYTCNCGYSYTGDNVSSTGHDYSKVVTVPTCTESGYTTYTCHCGHSYIGDYVDASGHSYEAKITLSTCTNGGYTEFTCECGDHYIGDYTDKLEHSYIDGICTNCGEEDPNFTTEIDPNAPQIVVSNGIGIAGDTVTITVDLKNNPGFAGMNAYLTYSESLKLVEVKNHINLTFTSDATMVWDGVTDYTEDGQLLTLVFEVSDTAYEGDHFVKINFIEAYTAELNDVEFKTVEGCVTVIDFVYGDADGDGIVNTKDIILIRHYVAAKNPVTGISDIEVSVGADANGDGVVNTKDIILVRRYVAAKDPITGESSVVLGPNA